jgi:hypothetical protein
MDIAALSMGLSSMNLSNEIGASVLKMAMDTVKDQSAEMTKMMEMSVNPHIGGSIDIKL